MFDLELEKIIGRARKASEPKRKLSKSKLLKMNSRIAKQNRCVPATTEKQKENRRLWAEVCHLESKISYFIKIDPKESWY